MHHPSSSCSTGMVDISPTRNRLASIQMLSSPRFLSSFFMFFVSFFIDARDGMGGRQDGGRMSRASMKKLGAKACLNPMNKFSIKTLHMALRTTLPMALSSVDAVFFRRYLWRDAIFFRRYLFRVGVNRWQHGNYIVKSVSFITDARICITQSPTPDLPVVITRSNSYTRYCIGYMYALLTRDLHKRYA